MRFGPGIDEKPVFRAGIFEEFGDRRLQLVFGRSGTGKREFRLKGIRERFEITKIQVHSPTRRGFLWQ